MSEYFVVFSNISSLPCIIYYQFKQKYYYSVQILLNSLFSFIHHMKHSNVYPIYDMGLFSYLDGLYSYMSIYLFSMYLFLSNHGELKMELLIMNTLLMSLIFVSFGSVILLPLALFLILFITGMHYQHFNGLKIYNRYLFITILMCIIDIVCFSVAITYKYDYFHSIHHLVSFNIPIFINMCLEYDDNNMMIEHNQPSRPLSPNIEMNQLSRPLSPNIENNIPMKSLSPHIENNIPIQLPPLEHTQPIRPLSSIIEQISNQVDIVIE